MVDAGALFALGKRLAGEAIRTSGTRVRAFTETTVTGDDLTQVTDTVVLYDGPVIVTVAVQGGAGSSEFLPGFDIRPGAWQVTALPSAPDLPEGSVLEVVRCADKMLVGRQAKVLTCVRDSSGAVVKVVGEPRKLKDRP
jgi:hypothetical protein